MSYLYGRGVGDGLVHSREGGPPAQLARFAALYLNESGVREGALRERHLSEHGTQGGGAGGPQRRAARCTR